MIVVREYLSEVSQNEKQRLLREYLAACNNQELKWVRIDDVCIHCMSNE